MLLTKQNSDGVGKPFLVRPAADDDLLLTMIQ